MRLDGDRCSTLWPQPFGTARRVYMKQSGKTRPQLRKSSLIRYFRWQRRLPRCLTARSDRRRRPWRDGGRSRRTVSPQNDWQGCIAMPASRRRRNGWVWPVSLPALFGERWSRRLPKVFGQVVVEDRVPAEVAAGMGITSNTVRQAESRALRFLEEEMRERIAGIPSVAPPDDPGSESGQRTGPDRTGAVLTHSRPSSRDCEATPWPCPHPKI